MFWFCSLIGTPAFWAAQLTRVALQIVVTQKSIRHVLRERWYAWEDANTLYQKGYRPAAEEAREESATEEATEEESEPHDRRG